MQNGGGGGGNEAHARGGRRSGGGMAAQEGGGAVGVKKVYKIPTDCSFWLQVFGISLFVH